jgi:PAS domain S-box-containing protein
MSEKTRILIVEDLPTDAELGEREVRQALPNCEFTRVESREAFLSALGDFKPHLILCDYKLPQFDGLTALRLSLTHAPETPFIIVTGSMDEDTAVACMKAGAWDYVIKEHIKRLGPAVLNAVEQSRLRREKNEADAHARRWQQVFAEAHFGLAHADAATNTFIEVNATFARERGYRPEELKGRPIADVYAPEAHEEMRRRIECIDATGHEVFEVVHLRKDGSRFPVLMEVTTIRDEQGRPRSRVAYALDISERKGAEQALVESETLFRNLFEHHAAVKLIIDPESGRIVDANRAATDFYGWSRDQLRKMRIQEINTLPAEEVQQLIEKVRTQKKIHFEFQHRLADGTARDVESFSSKIEAKGRTFLHSIIHDISGRKEAERALQESEHKFRMIVENSRDIIYTLDEQGRFLFVSPAMRFLLGYDETALIGSQFQSIIHPDDAPGCQQAMRRIVEMGVQTPGFEYRARHADGTYRWHTSSGGAVHDADGRLLHFQGVARDITERRNLEEQLRQAQKMESVGRLAGGVAHDYNNMLSVIVGYTELALAGVASSDPLHADLKEIYHAALRSAEITRQLLAFARRQTIAPEVLDLNGIVENLLKMLRRLIGEDISLAWLPETGLWPVRMDPSQFNQIIANLCVNARDAIADVGKIVIETKNISLDENYCAVHAGFMPGAYVLLMVSDDGCGMSKEVLDHLFEPFFTTKGIGKGTGLGLATVYGIVKQNDGFINVYSEPGKGTTFKIYLPRFLGQRPEAPTEKEEPPPGGHGEGILVVEDEEAILMLAQHILVKLGYQVWAAGSAGEAIDLGEKHKDRIHLLVTDVVMPEMNGRELAQRLQSHTPKLKCLFMSGYTADIIASRGVLGQGVHFLQKPFSTRDLARKVREALDDE